MIRPFCIPLISAFLLLDIGLHAQVPTVPLDTQLSPEKVTLRYRFQEGETWNYELREKGAQVARSEAGEQTAINNSAQWKHYQILETYEDGSALIEVVVDRIHYHFTSIVDDQKQVISYDTQSEEKPPALLKGIENSLGTFAKVKMSANGELLEVDFGRKAQQEELKQTGKIQGLPMKLPAEPVSVGDSWSHKIPVRLEVARQFNLKKKLFADFKVHTNYELKKLEGDEATIGFSTIVQPRITDPVLRGRMLQYLPSGTVLFDIKEGKILSRTENIDDTVLNVGGPKTAMEMKSQKIEQLVPERAKLRPAAN